MRNATPRGLARTLVVVLALATGLAALEAQTRRPRKPASSPSSAQPARKPLPLPARTDTKVPFRAGERLTYDISWSGHLTAGEATMVVKERRASFGSMAYYIVAEGRPVGLLARLHSLYYKADTLLDCYALLPQRGSIYSQEGARHRLRITRFDHLGHRAEYEVQTTTNVKSVVAIPRHTQDALSAVYALRSVPLAPQSRLTMPVCDGGTTYRVTFGIGTAEPVTTPAGTVTALRVTPTVLDEQGHPVGGRMTVWISADERRIPIKLRVDVAIGSLDLVLRQVVS
ncbi:MAG TPA: DUF3108 domain-containing protein [Vicinamibacterales bacterium]|jgi:hypothetical protein